MAENPEKGKILISEPFLLDPNFKRTIILLTEHGEEGSLGFVLNKPTEHYIHNLVEDVPEFNAKHYIHNLVEDFPEFNAKVFYGGPVQLNVLQFIYRSDYAYIDNSIEVIPGLFWGGNFDLLKTMIQAGSVKAEDFRFFLGYSGWGEEQLNDEIKINSWIVADSTIENIFSEEPDKLWRDTLKGMGKKFAILASFPENPSVN